MNFLSLALSAGLSLCFLALVFRPLEATFPAKPGQRFFRPDWFTDLCFFFGQYLLWSGLVLWALSGFSDWINGVVPDGFRLAVASQPWWLQAVEVIVLSDFFIYWGHRLQHRVGFLWRFHSVHHSSEHLDWLAAHREHPLDSIYTVGLINLPALLLGFPLETLTGFIIFRGLWAIYIHSNVRLPIGPFARILGSPQIHHWHHDRDRDAGNYANLSPLMDILFGTYYCPDHDPERFGLDEGGGKGWVGHMVGPLIPSGESRVRLATSPLVKGRDKLVEDEVTMDGEVMDAKVMDAKVMNREVMNREVMNREVKDGAAKDGAAKDGAAKDGAANIEHLR